MAKYKALVTFRDIEENHVYKKDEPWPRNGRPKKERVEALTTSANQSKRPLVAEIVEEDKPSSPSPKRKRAPRKKASE